MPTSNDLVVLFHVLGLAALIANAVQYRLLIRLRAERRLALTRAEAQEDGLRGLVRAKLLDG